VEFGIIKKSIIFPVFVIDERTDVNVPVPEIIPELETEPPLLYMFPELAIVPELEMVPNELS